MKQISFQNDILPLKNKLYRLALRITLNPADAEDVVQETMIKVWNRREQWTQLESVEAFCLDMSLHDAPDRSHFSNPEDQTVMQDRILIVKRLVDSLPEKQRTAMQLRDFEGKSYKDIANIMDITEQQVKVNIFRARQTVKQKFLQEEDYGL